MAKDPLRNGGVPQIQAIISVLCDLGGKTSFSNQNDYKAIQIFQSFTEEGETIELTEE